MTHLNEFCPKDCLFDTDNPVEKQFACNLCWVSEVMPIVPALPALIWGKDGLVIASYKDKYIVEEIMSNGQPSRSSVHKSRVKFK